MNDDERPLRTGPPAVKGEVLLTLGAAAVMVVAVFVVDHVEEDIGRSEADPFAAPDAAADVGDAEKREGVDDQTPSTDAQGQEANGRWLR